MTDPACKDCRFYQPSQSHSPRGYCHYNPPAHVSGRDMGYFVMVYGSDWCGRFAPKGQPEEHRRQIFDVYTGAVRDEQEGKKLPNVWGEEYNLLPNVLPREDAPPEKADESMDESDSEDSAMSMSEFMDWQEKKLLELLQDDREAVERYKKAFLQFIDDREKDEEARRRGPRMSDLFSPTIRIRPVVEEREEEEEPLKEREPAQTDWEADQITTHNERYAERVRNIGRLAQNAYQRKMDESAADLGMGEEPELTVYGVPLSEYPNDLLGNDGLPTYEHTIEFLRRRYPRDVARRPELYTREEEWEEVKVEEAWPGYQDIVDQIGEALAHVKMTTAAGTPIYRSGEPTEYFHGELWEFLINPVNQSGMWWIEYCYPDGSSCHMRWRDGLWVAHVYPLTS